MAIFQLVYTSEETGAMTGVQLRALGTKALRFNDGLGISGMLLCGGGKFMQCLEGDERAVNKLFSRISQDPRHTNVQCLLRRNVMDRLFAQWGMALIETTGMPALDRQRIETALARATSRDAEDSTLAAMALLNEFSAQLMGEPSPVIR
jgi:hypothetical protein